MTTSESWMLAAILAILVVLVLLSAAEMSLTRISRQRALTLAGRRRGARIAKLVEDPRRWVNQLLLTVNILQTIQAMLTAVLANRLFGGVGVAVAVAANVVVFFVLTEAMPKTYAALNPERGAELTAPLVQAIAVFWPLKWIAVLLIRLTNLVLPGKGLKEGPFIDEQEFLGFVEEAHKDAVIEEEERDLIESVMNLGDKTVVDVMVPAPDIVSLRNDVTVTEALDTAVQHQISRLPVLLETGGQTGDNGLLYTKDLIALERAGKGNEPVSRHLKELVVVPESLLAGTLMRRMQAEKFHLALTADEYGGISGLVTLEDCLEELVGEIFDEHDEENPVLDTRNGKIRTRGTTTLADLNKAIEEQSLGEPIRDEEHVSIGGLVFGRIGRQPNNGESITIGSWRITVESMNGRRVDKVRLDNTGRADNPAAKENT